MNVPKLRFKEFNDEYKKYTFAELADYKKGPFGSALKKEIFVPKSENSVKVYEQQNAIKKDWTLERYFITKEYYKKLKGFTIGPGDIIVSCAGTIGEYYVLPNEAEMGVINQALMRIITNKKVNQNYFLYIFDNMVYNFSKTFSNGSAIKNIPPFADLKKQIAYIPTIEEQNKVSIALKLLDKKIELQSKKIEDLKLFKKGLHDKLFNDVTGNDYLLSDIAVFENGKGHENIVDENGKYILINSKFISTEGNVTKKCSEQLTPLFKNDITMVMSDLPNGKALAKCYYIDENNKYSLNQRICKIKVKDDSIVNSKYLFYLLNRNSYYLRFDDGVNQTNLKKDDILSLNLVLPSIKDQERDSKTLTIIDNIIEKENNKLSKLNLLKKGLMQSMFV